MSNFKRSRMNYRNEDGTWDDMSVDVATGAQNFLDYETIVVCNGCTDQTESIANKYLNRRTRILSLEKALMGQALNQSLNMAEP